MTRLHTDQVEVHRRDDEPDQFLWKGRLYVVREVLARWTEAGGWWRGSSLRALTAGDHAPEHSVHTGIHTGIDDGERDWWRVEAGSGRPSGSSAGTGVYDLCLNSARGTWSLARVLD